MSFTAEWTPLGDVFYRKQEFYNMGWADDQLDLSRFIIAAAPYGGPIALIRDDGKIIKQENTKPIIYIFTASGQDISRIKWSSGKVLKIGWSSTEELLCIQDDGTVLVYDIFGVFLRNFSLGQEAKDSKIISCQIFNNYGSTGFAGLTSTYRIYFINKIEDIRIRRMAEVSGLNTPPSSWVVINQDKQTRVLISKDKDIYLLDQSGRCELQTVPISGQVNSYIEMAVSFNNKYLALFTDTGILWIGSSDLKVCYCEFDTKCHARPSQLVWCGTGAIVGYWENILLMVGPQKDWVKYPYESPIHLVPEIDGLRIIGTQSHEFLQRVPGVVQDVFKIASMAPGALLHQAFLEFQKKSQKSDEYIRAIKDNQEDAVYQCIQAAGYEIDPSIQKSLLKAASFGKCFLTNYKPDEFVKMCQTLRVLNAVREFSVGITITYAQLEQLSMPVLIDRLVLRRHFCLAIRICQYLNLPNIEGASRILAHWACFKVQQTNMDDDHITQAIVSKLGETPGVSYSEIANKGIECGRTELAIKLLDYEPKAAEQVPLLMKMKRDKLALEKAIESGDTDLVYSVLLDLKDTMSEGEFFMEIRTIPTAHALFLQHCREQNRAMLRVLFYQEDNHEEEANCIIQESYEEERIDSRSSQLVAASDAFKKAKNEWAATETDDQIKLLKFQKKLEEEYNRSYINLSLHQTIYQLTLENNNKYIKQLRKDFKIPERRFWWCRVNALGEAGDWLELDKFSRSQKSPIGYEPFVDACLKYGNKEEAIKYCQRVLPKEKVSCLIKVGLLEEAAELAYQNKNEEELKLVIDKTPASNKQLLDRINVFRVQISSRR